MPAHSRRALVGPPDCPTCLYEIACSAAAFCSRPRSRRTQTLASYYRIGSSSRRLPRRDIRGEEALRLHFFEVLTRVRENGSLAGILLPAPHGDIDIAGCKLN